MTAEPAYVVAGSRPWARQVFDETLSQLPGRWSYAASPADLSADTLAALSPRYVFFLHWSWRVPAEVFESFECVCFHMTDVPYGRGGSPLQNLILAGHAETKLSALRMVAAFDAGPVYLKAPLSLAGRADEIYARACDVAAGMIRTIIETHPEPQPQVGTPVVFRRRRPEESEIPADAGLDSVYDFIRMLDADGYPHAFLEHGDLRFELRHAVRDGDAIRADVRIVPRLKGDK